MISCLYHIAADGLGRIECKFAIHNGVNDYKVMESMDAFRDSMIL